jgi:hypothetical protein
VAPVRVFGWAATVEDGSYRYRVEMPLNAAAQAGHDTGHDVRITADWITSADTIAGQRVCKPAPTERWQAMARTGRWLVYEVDDDLLNVDPGTPAAPIYADPVIRANIVANAAAAGRVTVSTNALAEVMSVYNPNVVVVPNAVPDYLLTLTRPRRDRVTIGWTPGIHVADWPVIRGPLRRFLARNRHVDLHLIGSRFPTPSWPPYRHTPWVHGLDGYYQAIDFDIGIAPLQWTIFNRSKSHIKALEYAALGIPVVATAARPYEEYVRHGETGYLVRRDYEWDKYLRMLVEDTAMREEMGAKARQVAAAYTISRWLPAWVEAWHPA